ncbi:hypothetical protein AVEN_198454-1 [Araneus ventricosus]|uniref:Uncharacterized protein n=1 Tax=Araneus ventricosus TaxID=182803 RepID=A0A4Y2ETD7_ARAVE|nr:hypothetical protein AVEN_198454-1 [Araneus ventricosus]
MAFISPRDEGFIPSLDNLPSNFEGRLFLDKICQGSKEKENFDRLKTAQNDTLVLCSLVQAAIDENIILRILCKEKKRVCNEISFFIWQNGKTFNNEIYFVF